MQAHGHDHAPAHDSQGTAGGAADPDWGFWLGGTLLFMGGLGLLFVLSADHTAGKNLAPVMEASARGHHGEGKPVRASEEQQMAEVLAALAGHGVGDDSVPAEATADIKFIIQAVAESKLRFKLDGEPKTAAEVSDWMLKRWQNSDTPMASAEVLMERTSGFTLVKQMSNRVVFADGSEQALTTWLQIQLAQHNGTPLPPINTRPTHAPPRANKKKQKPEQAGQTEKAETPKEQAPK
jgi:hypothetical protein